MMAEFGKKPEENSMVWDDNSFECTKSTYEPSIKKPTNSANRRTKQIPFERLEVDQYKKQAKCVTFKTSMDRMPLWLHALKIRYFDNLGNSDEYSVDWTNHPPKGVQMPVDTDPNEPLHDIVDVCISVSSLQDDGEMSKLATITVYLTSMTIMIQGNEFDLFVMEEFPLLKHLVDVGVTHHLATEDVLNESEPEYEPDTEPKIIDGEGDGNTNTADSMKQSGVRNSEKQKARNPDQGKVKESNALQQIADGLTNFVKIRDIIENMEQQLVNKLIDFKDDNAKLHQDLLTRDLQLVVHQKNALEKDLSLAQKENRELKKELEMLKTKTPEVMNKSEAELVVQLRETQKENRELKNELEMLKTKTPELREEIIRKQRTIEHLNSELDMLVSRNMKKNEEIENAESRIHKLQNQLAEAQDERLTLTNTIHALEMSNEPFKDVNHTTKKPAEPEKVYDDDLLLIGTSIIKDIQPEGLMKGSRIKTIKKTAYHASEAEKVIADYSGRPKCVVVQLMSNDLKSCQPGPCVDKLEHVVKAALKKFACPVIVSLPVPRADSVDMQLKTEDFNTQTKRRFLDNEEVSISDNSNLSRFGNPHPPFYDPDMIHLLPSGSSILAGNIRHRVSVVLKLDFQQPNNSGTTTGNAFNPRSPPRDRKQFNGGGRGRGGQYASGSPQWNGPQSDRPPYRQNNRPPRWQNYERQENNNRWWY